MKLLIWYKWGNSRRCHSNKYQKLARWKKFSICAKSLIWSTQKQFVFWVKLNFYWINKTFLILNLTQNEAQISRRIRVRVYKRYGQQPASASSQNQQNGTEHKHGDRLSAEQIECNARVDKIKVSSSLSGHHPSPGSSLSGHYILGIYGFQGLSTELLRPGMHSTCMLPPSSMPEFWWCLNNKHSVQCL